MKSRMFKSVAMLSLFVAVGFGIAASANGQSIQCVKSHVPFEFVVGDQAMPAGDYAIRSADMSGTILRIQNPDAGASTVRLTNTISLNRKKTEARLVFHRYGSNYFLAEVWEGGDRAGRQLLESKQEKALRRESKTLAQNGYETIELVAVLTAR